jgi:hypothetical protein
MKKIYVLVIALAMAAAMAATPSGSGQGSSSSAVGIKNEATNAPFRDGLYLGGLTAKAGDAPHVAVGRWSKNQDRISFAEGYRLGYTNSLAVSTAAVTSVR